MKLFLVVNKLTGFLCGFFGGFLSLNFPLLMGFKVVFLLVLLVVFSSDVKGLENGVYFGFIITKNLSFA